jgi:hypothetical protein
MSCLLAQKRRSAEKPEIEFWTRGDGVRKAHNMHLTDYRYVSYSSRELEAKGIEDTSKI